MEIGIPKERSSGGRIPEHRVALTPSGVRELVLAGAKLYVEAGAGAKAGFDDDAYRRAGATVVYDPEEVYRRAELVLAVGRPNEQASKVLGSGTVVMGFLHLAAAPRDLVRRLLDRGVTAIGLEVIQRDDGVLPVLQVMSEIAGRLAPQFAGQLLESPRGPGVLLSGLPGIPPADVVIVGAGTLGLSAARAFLGARTQVYVLDRSRDRLELVDQLLDGRAVTALATSDSLDKFSAFADVLVGAAHVPGQRAPVVVTRDMVRRMRRGAVLIDFAIDEGGIAETSTPRGGDFVFNEEGVTHFCAPNVPALVARTASHALSHALVPLLRELVETGTGALDEVAPLRRGVYVRAGKIVHPGLAGARAA
jgi:alanine dehydrogenase